MLKRTGRTFVIAVVLAACAVAGTLAQQRWYQLYDEGITAFRRQQWDVAEARFKAALAANPKQGRQVFFYGTRRDDYLPDYYLAQIYLRAGRGTDAAPLITSLEKSGLMKPGDREYTEFDRMSAQVRALARSNPPDTGPARGGPVAQPQPPVDPNPVPGRGNGTTVTTNPATTNPVTTNPVTVNPTNAEATARGSLPPDTRPTANGSAAAKPDAPSVNDPGKLPDGKAAVAPRARPGPIPPSYTRRPPVGPVAPPTTTIVELERQALSAFYRGEYAQAQSILEGGDYEKLATTDLSRRKRLFYLACSNAALALTETGPGDRLSAARTDFVTAQGNGPSFADDRRYISPRILSALTGAPYQSPASSAAPKRP